MGNRYKNITIVGPSQANVVAAVETHDRQAYVTPTRNGVTVVFDRASEDSGGPEELGDLTLTLSQELECPALAAAVFDDDTLILGPYARARWLVNTPQRVARHSARAVSLEPSAREVGRSWSGRP